MSKSNDLNQTVQICLLHSGFTSLWTNFQSYCDGIWMWQGAQCSLLECCLTEIAPLKHLTWYSIKSHYIDTELTSSDFLFYFLNTEQQAKEQLVPFLKSLVWPGWGLSLQPPCHKGDALPTEPLSWFRLSRSIVTFCISFEHLFYFFFCLNFVVVFSCIWFPNHLVEWQTL